MHKKGNYTGTSIDQESIKYHFCFYRGKSSLPHKMKLKLLHMTF